MQSRTYNKKIDEKFSDIIREKMSNKEFWKWAVEWLDPDMICEIAEDWDEEDKKDLIKNFNIKHKK